MFGFDTMSPTSSMSWSTIRSGMPAFDSLLWLVAKVLLFSSSVGHKTNAAREISRNLQRLMLLRYGSWEPWKVKYWLQNTEVRGSHRVECTISARHRSSAAKSASLAQAIDILWYLPVTNQLPAWWRSGGKWWYRLWNCCHSCSQEVALLPGGHQYVRYH